MIISLATRKPLIVPVEPIEKPDKPHDWKCQCAKCQKDEFLEYVWERVR